MYLHKFFSIEYLDPHSKINTTLNESVERIEKLKTIPFKEKKKVYFYV